MTKPIPIPIPIPLKTALLPDTVGEAERLLQTFERTYNCVLRKTRITYDKEHFNWCIDGLPSEALTLEALIAEEPSLIRYIYPAHGPKIHDPKLITRITHLT